MYTRDEQETFSGCLARLAIGDEGLHILRAFGEAAGDPKDPQKVTPMQVVDSLRRSAYPGAGLVQTALAELARHAREDGVPIEVTEDLEGTLWYALSAEQAGLIHAQVTGRPSYPFSQSSALS